MKVTDKIKCLGCKVEYEITYNHRDGLPNICPFCNGEVLEISEEEKISHGGFIVPTYQPREKQKYFKEK